MPTQRRFEGPTLAAVLAKVQKEVGTNAKIVSAQKVRSGGFLGFFQSERYEVLVDVDASNAATAPPSAPAEPAASAAASVMDLVDQVNEQETPKAADSKTAPATEAPAPAVSTESDSFAEILSKMAYQSDMKSEPEAEVVAETELNDEEPVEEPALVVAEETVVAEKSDLSDEPEPVVAEAEPEPKPEPAVAEAVPDVEPEPEPEPVALEPVAVEPVAVERVVSAPVTLEPTARIVPAVVDLDQPRTRATDHPLAKLGLPVHFIPDYDAESVTTASALQKVLVNALEALPVAPKVRPSKGSVIAVVGDRDEAMWTAEELALKWNRPKEEIVLASQHYRAKTNRTVVRTVRSAEDGRRSWSRRTRPTIVVIDTPLGAQNTSWAEHILTALEPIATYGIADATRKAEDITAWVEALGGVDALALNHVEETVSPASVLTTGIPVDSIDGRSATPAYWAMLLAERLTAA